ncbi:MAG: CBS domain-containing protein [Dehalococcoidia bacterium]
MTMKALSKRAEDVMSAPPVTVDERASMADAARVMVEKNIGCLPVVNSEGDFIGMVTERTFQAELAGLRPDSSRSEYERLIEQMWINPMNLSSISNVSFESVRKGPVTSGMIEGPTCAPQTQLWEVAERLFKSHLSHIAVVKDDKPVGVIARHDLLKAYFDEATQASGGSLG